MKKLLIVGLIAAGGFLTACSEDDDEFTSIAPSTVEGQARKQPLDNGSGQFTDESDLDSQSNPQYNEK